MGRWEAIKGFEGLYSVSDQGQVKSEKRKISRRDTGNFLHLPSKILKPLERKNYLWVYLSRCSIKHHKRVHRLVAEAFIPNPENKPYVNHIDSDPANNHVDNLEWCTQKENVHHAIRKGRHKTNDTSIKPEKLTQVKQMLEAGYSRTEVSKTLKVCAKTIIKFFGKVKP